MVDSQLHTPVMPLDGRQSETALSIQTGVCSLLIEMDFAPVTEVTLGSGRRADVMALGPTGDLWIIEIKSSEADYRADRKWHTYRDYCDRFFFAAASDDVAELLPADEGLILADRWGAEIVRDAERVPLNASRRKAAVARYARTAAFRLLRLPDRLDA
ncbi:MAG: MmcB family DNA repair protein [Pseudomonadota bacterium]